ncbi:MAG TPA: Ig-like domain-containing protein, partial [Blastocatellia bacterium]|nr:Ig-like domain-containing protein [Blastocatellia bacterium]
MSKGSRFLPKRPPQINAQQFDNPSQRAGQITHFRLCPRHLKLYTEESFTLVPLALDRNQEAVHGVAFDWQTSNAAVAKVSSWGEVTARAPGQAIVTVSVGTARASVSVDVQAGVRPRQTDAEWDSEHAGDCDDPEAAELQDSRDDLARQGARRMASADVASNFGIVDSSSLKQRLQAALPRQGTLPARRHARKAAMASAGGKMALGGLPQPGGVGGLIDGSGGDPAATQATTGFSNAVGYLRFSPMEVSAGSAARTRNNLGSYNYLFSAPVLALGGRGLGVNLALVYNSRVWSKDGSQMTFNYGKGWPAAGWSLGYGRVIENYDNTAFGDGSGVGSPNSPGNRLLIQPDGSRIHLQTYYDSSSGKWAFQSTDNSFLWMSSSDNLNYPDGTVVKYTKPNNRLVPTTIIDANGNIINIAYKTFSSGTFPFRWAIDYIYDTLGRYIQFNYDPTTHYLTSITAPDQGTGTRTLVQIDYQTITLQYSFKSTLTVNAPTTGSQIDVVKRIYYPQTGRGYVFPDYNSYGMARRVSTRIGMTPSGDGTEVAYTYYNYVDTSNQVGALNDAPQYTTRSEWWQGKTDDSGNPTAATTDYTYARTSGTDGGGYATEIDTATSQNGNLQIITTTGNDASNPTDLGHVVSIEYKDLANHSLKKITNTYVAGPDAGYQIDTTTTAVDGSPAMKTSFTYGNYGRVSTVDEYGYTASVQRRTSYSYLDTASYISSSLKQLVTEVEVYDGGNLTTPVAKTAYAYDNYNITGGMQNQSPLPPNHNENYGTTQTVRGNVTTVTSWSDIAADTSIVRNRKYDIFGNVVRADVSCCQVKNFTFSDATTHYSQPDSVVDGTEGTTPFLKTTYDYDLNTGLLLDTTDPTGLTTSYGYDAAWRPLTVTAPQGAYTVTTQVDKDTNGNDLLAYSQKTVYTDTDNVQKTVWAKSWFDGAGRVIRAGSGQGSTPTGYDTVATVYDSMGRVLKQSNPYAGDSSGNGTASYWTVNVYDPLSRVTEVDLPDDQPTGQRSRIQTAYATPLMTVTDQVGRKRQSQADGLGRMVSVTEQDPASGSLSLTTSYGYDALDNLTSIDQGGQTRTYAYDALSRLKTQTTPEAGTSSFFYTDSGTLLKRVEARQVETHYQYDTLNRLTHVWYSGLGGADDPSGTRPTLPSGVAATSDVEISYNNLSTAAAGNGQVSQVTDGDGVHMTGYSGVES